MSLRGDRITRLRREKGYTQSQLAQRLNVGQNQVSRYEHGAYNPSLETLVKMANELDTTTDYLLGVSNRPQRDAEPEPDLSDIERQVVELLREYVDEAQHEIVNAVNALLLAWQKRRAGSTVQIRDD
jgi:transcriptional regulator with XRE-family HTH domain